jgi:hypothetical protein
MGDTGGTGDTCDTGGTGDTCDTGGTGDTDDVGGTDDVGDVGRTGDVGDGAILDSDESVDIIYTILFNALNQLTANYFNSLVLIIILVVFIVVNFFIVLSIFDVWLIELLKR